MKVIFYDFEVHSDIFEVSGVERIEDNERSIFLYRNIDSSIADDVSYITEIQKSDYSKMEVY